MAKQLKDLPLEELLESEKEYTESDQQIDDVVDEAANEKQGPAPFKISSYGADYTADSLAKRMESGAFFVPPFQRSYVWTQRQASRFVESLLLGLPVPGIFVCKEEGSARHLVIDGQQRLKTIQWYFAGAFKERVFRLVDVQDPWVGKTYRELHETDRQRLDDTIIHTTVFKQDDPKDNASVFHVFERLNTSGVRLQPQEIRNCIYYGEFTKLLDRLNDAPDWRAIYGRKNDRLKDRELILRFLALFFDRKNYQSPMKDFLNSFIANHRNPGPSEAKEFESSFSGAISLVRASLGDRAFRPERSLNAAVFDSVMVGVAARLGHGDVKDTTALAAAYDKLLLNDDFKAAYLRSTANEESVAARLRLSIAAFDKCR